MKLLLLLTPLFLLLGSAATAQKRAQLQESFGKLRTPRALTLERERMKMELIAALLLFSRWHGVGALMALGIMSGAIVFHLFTPLGVVMPEFNAVGEVIGNDGGLLFGMACLVWLSAAFLTLRDTKHPQGTLNQIVAKWVY